MTALEKIATRPFIRTGDVLAERLSGPDVLELDQLYGNRDLLGGLDILGVAGPFYAVSPWELEDGESKQYINASGYAALPFGDMPPALRGFVKDYLQSSRAVGLPQQSASPWRAALGANLVKLLTSVLPSHADSQVFFSSSGTEAVEGALKFAKAWRPKAKHFISFSGGYHGKTYGSLSVTPNSEYQDVFRPLVPGAVTSPYGDLEALRTLIRRLGPDKVVAVIVEPIQGEAGVRMPPPGFLSGLSALCREHGIVVIADEIQTGLGRTGHWFESAARGMDPDIITLAKPLGGGMSAVGATIVRAKIFQKMLSGLSSKRHSNTFGGNALAMAIGLKSLELLIDQDLPTRSRELGMQGLAWLRQLQHLYPELIQDVRGQGLLLAMQFHPVVGAKLPGALDGAMHEATVLLAVRGLHQSGVMANMSLSNKRTVRFTPALDIPQHTYEELLERVEHFCEAYPRAGKLLSATPPMTLLKLGRLALK